MIRVDHWSDAVASGEWRWERFSAELMACRCCGRLEIDQGFMDRLSALREAFGEPMRETSGYRCPIHNANESPTGLTGPHTMGRAVDIAIYGKSLFKLLPLAFEHGFTGIGDKQKSGSDYNQRFLHLDDLQDHEHTGPRPWKWTY